MSKTAKVLTGFFGLVSGTALQILTPQAEENIKTILPIFSWESVLSEPAAGIFMSGVSFEGSSLAGMTLQDAEIGVDQWISDFETRKVTFSVLGNPFEYTASDLGLIVDDTLVKDELKNLVSSQDRKKRYEQWKALQEAAVDISAQTTVDDTVLYAVVDNCISSYQRPLQNASVVRTGGQFAVTPHQSSISFDGEAIKAQLRTMLTESRDSELTYDMPYTEEQPGITAEMLSFSPTPIGSYSTSNLGIPNRKNNIAVSAQNMNGHLFMPGEQISTLAMYGEVSSAAGFLPAPGYDSGKQVDVIGGGICQTTTTLYNAVLRAELQVLYRRNHSMMVTYVPPGMDATVAPAYGSDFVFANSTGYPIYIESYVDGDNVVVNIWGTETRPPERTIDFSYQVNSISWPGKLYEQRIDDVNCKVGQAPVEQKIYTVVDPHPSLKAVSYKHVFVNGVETEVTQLNSDTYKPMTGLLYHASDCWAEVSILPDSSENRVFKFLGCTIFIDLKY